MGLGLDRIQFLFGEVGGGKGIVDTEPVDGPLQTARFSSGESTCVDDSCEVVAFIGKSR